MNYPDLQGRYNFTNSLSYVLIRVKPNINYEFSLGVFSYIGDPIARESLQKGHGNSKFLLINTLSVGLRYNLKKIPLQFRLTATTLYSFKWKERIPILPSLSIGYGFKKIKNERPSKKGSINSNSD